MQKVIKTFGKYLKDANGILSSKSKAVLLVQKAFFVLSSNKTSLNTITENLKLLANAVTDITSGKYKGFPKKSALLIIAGLLYLVSPIDVIPDWIFGTGFIDDIYVINLILKRLDTDLKVYKTWKNSQVKTISIN